MDDGPTRFAHLVFNSPLSERRADAIVARLASAAPAEVLDVGCGLGELLLRVAAASPTSRCKGIDTDRRLLDRAVVTARRRGLSGRVTFRHHPAAELDSPADLVLCVGSSHALAEEVGPALAHLRRLTRPGGRALFGTGYWEPRGSVDESLAYEDMRALPDLATLVDIALSTGFRPLYIETANEQDWNAFESGYLADAEEWLMTNSGHPDAARVRVAADDHRCRWLRGYRHALGFAFLTLGLPR